VVYADYVNILGESPHNIKENEKALTLRCMDWKQMMIK
jgi:hypothetical protein